MSAAPYHKGFTLVELVVAISVSTVVMGFIALLISQPVDMYISQSRRVELTDSADSLWLNMSRDLPSTVPNSVRYQQNGTVIVLEMLETYGWAHYYTPTGPDTVNTLAASSADTDFDIAGWSAITSSAGASVLNSTAADPDALTTDPYQIGTGKATYMSGVNVGAFLNGVAHVTPQGASFHFAGDSPSKRIYFISEPITYLCDTRAQTIRRYHGYTAASSQTSRNTAAKLTAAGAKVALVAANVASCQFRWQQLPSPGGRVLSVDATFTKAATSTGPESVKMSRRFFLGNLP
jgi:MSHA biogenesis protein MshO